MSINVNHSLKCSLQRSDCFLMRGDLKFEEIRYQRSCVFHALVIEILYFCLDSIRKIVSSSFCFIQLLARNLIFLSNCVDNSSNGRKFKKLKFFRSYFFAARHAWITISCSPFVKFELFSSRRVDPLQTCWYWEAAALHAAALCIPKVLRSTESNYPASKLFLRRLSSLLKMPKRFLEK